MFSVVLDTNVLISATLWDWSSAQKFLFKLIQSNIKIYSSPEIICEYYNVLTRDFDYTDDELFYILEKVLSFVTLVTIKSEINLIKDDPDDNKIIECALVSSSEYIITYDKHLLKFNNYNNLKIIKPEDATNLF